MSSKLTSFHKTFHHPDLKTEVNEQTLHSDVLTVITKAPEHFEVALPSTALA